MMPPQQFPDASASVDTETLLGPLFDSEQEECVSCAEDRSNYRNAIPVMTANTLPEGVASDSATSRGGSSYGAPWRALDGVPRDYSVQLPAGDYGWTINVLEHQDPLFPAWLKYQFPQAQTVTAYSIKAWDIYSAPRDFELQGSQDNASWVSLDGHMDVDWEEAEEKRFSFVNPTAYPYYRLLVTDTLGQYTVTVNSFGLFASESCQSATAISNVSQNDADAKASAIATAKAQSRLDCRLPALPPVAFNPPDATAMFQIIQPIALSVPGFPEAHIRYTYAEEDPVRPRFDTISSPLTGQDYTSVIMLPSVTPQATIKAIARVPGYADSPVAEASYSDTTFGNEEVGP